MQAAAIGPYIYSDLTPPPLRQAAWSQLRPSYDPPAPGTDDADLPCCSAGDGEAMTVLPSAHQKIWIERPDGGAV